MIKYVFDGYVLSTFKPVWTRWNWLNLASMVQKTRPEAEIRYDTELEPKNKIVKVRITIEEINESK